MWDGRRELGPPMNRRIYSVALAAVVVGGVAAMVVPQHTVSIARVLATAVAAVAGGCLLAAVGPLVSREAPRTALDSMPRAGAPPLDPHGLRDARRDLGRPCARGSVPRPVWDRLVVRARMQLEEIGHDLDDPRSQDAVADRVPDRTIRLLGAPPPHGDHRDPAGAAALVHRTLDDLSHPNDRSPYGHH